MNGICAASSASRSATLVWVNAAGLNRMTATRSIARRVNAADQLSLRVALEGVELVASRAAA